MIYLQYHVLHPKTLIFKGSYEKSFSNTNDFIQEYRLAKVDFHLVMNVCFYNPKELYGQKDLNDVKLYSLNANEELLQ